MRVEVGGQPLLRDGGGQVVGAVDQLERVERRAAHLRPGVAADLDRLDLRGVHLVDLNVDLGRRRRGRLALRGVVTLAAHHRHGTGQ